MTDFKQIIGRGTRVYEEGNKLFFNILDYTNSTILFEDEDFDGTPDLIVQSEIDEQGQTVEGSEQVIEPEQVDEENEDEDTFGFHGIPEEEDELPNKYVVDGGEGGIAEERVYELGADNRLRLSRLIDNTREQVRTLYRYTLEMQQRWADPVQRSEIIDLLAEQGIDFEELKEVTNQPEADPFDLLCHIAFDAPVLTCRQRAERLRRQKQDFFEEYGEEARAILEKLLDKYAERGVEEFNIPTTFKANQEFQQYGNVAEIAQRFGGIQQLREAVNQLQNLLGVA